MYWRSILVLKLAALLMALAMLFLFLVEPVWSASDNSWPNVPAQPQVTLQGNYPEILPGVTYDPAHQCVVDHNGPAVFCAVGMPIPIILYEYKDPSLMAGCGPPTYPFQVDGIAIELCNPELVPCTLFVVAQVYDANLTDPICPQPAGLLCQSETLMIVVPPTPACIEFDLPLTDTCCVTGPYYAAVNIVKSSCPPAVGPCLDEICDTCHSYWATPLSPLIETCGGGPFHGNWRICSWGRTFGQNDCKLDTCWYYKKGYLDYAPFGVPDFDQKQDQWVNSIGRWNYCGPTAVANCFWWFDSKFDSLSPGPPPLIHDGYPLFRWWSLPPALDDHDPANVPFLIPALATCMNTGEFGTNVFEMESCLVDWLKSVNLHDDYYESTYFRPEFDKVEREVERSQNVILLLGFYDMDCRRMGGHFVTMAGVCSEKWQIAISDPFFDRHEGNPPGPPAHGPTVHNDADLISGPHGTNLHDIYQAVPLMPPDPCLAWGAWELIDYPDSMQYVYNFEGQNEYPLNPNQSYQGGPIRTIVEFAVDVSPESCIAKPGDANASNTITLADVIAIVNYIFNKPGWPPCPSMSNLCWLSDLLCRGDVNGSITVTLSDVIYLVNYIFNKPGGPWTPIPNGKCCIPVQ